MLRFASRIELWEVTRRLHQRVGRFAFSSRRLSVSVPWLNDRTDSGLIINRYFVVSRSDFMVRYKNIVWMGLLAGAVITLPQAASGDPRGSYRRSLKNEIQQDRRELQDSRQELKSDLHELKQDRREFRQDRKSGASVEELARDKAEIRESQDNVRDSRREVTQDRRELDRDLREYNWRYGDRGRDDRGWWNPLSWWNWR